MLKFSLTLFLCLSFILTFKYFANIRSNEAGPTKSNTLTSIRGQSHSKSDSLHWPAGFTITRFAGPELTPSPACLAVAATGEVFVGVDMIGSLGKDPGKG